MDNWQKDYMNAKAVEVTYNKLVQDQLNHYARIFYNIAYEKYKIDKSLDKKVSFNQPDINEIYQLAKDSAELSNLKGDGYSLHCNDTDVSFTSYQLQKKVNDIYDSYIKCCEITIKSIFIFVILIILIFAAKLSV